MATDLRKHTAPAAAEAPRRQAINDLSMSIKDPIPVANTTERAQLAADLDDAGYGATVSRPLFVYRADAPVSARLEVTEDGTTWKPIGVQRTVMDAGTTSVSTGSTAGGSKAITFEVGVFTETPIVTATANSGAGEMSNVTVRVTNISASGCTLVVNNAVQNSSIGVNWIAVQKTGA